MVKKLAIDWDDSELRLVAAQCSGGSVKVSDAALVPIQDGDVAATLKQAIESRGLENTDTLIAIGRGKAELRDLELPVVPDDELPDMVRFQAIRSFASAGDSATVDYLVTNRDSERITMLAAAVGPAGLREIESTAKAANLTTKRIALRPLAAAALYLAKNKSATGEIVLIDLLAEDAEIVVARDRKVVFVRTVRLPSGSTGGPTGGSKALVSELKRSLIACGSNQSPDRVILWGRESVHGEHLAHLKDATSGPVEIVDPFALVDVNKDVQPNLPEHVGRLAPLVGLLQNDDTGAHRLIDFLNPRKRVEHEPNPLVRMLLIAAPITAALLIGFFAYKKLSDLDAKIALLKNANAQQKPKIDKANEKVARTARVDEFWDGNVNWLSEIRRLAVNMPPSDKMKVKSIVGTTDQRRGGGTLMVTGGVTNPEVIPDFEDALRDEHHQVVGEGSKQDERAKDAYRWAFNEKITVGKEFVRELRYSSMTSSESEETAESQPVDAEAPESSDSPSEATEPTESESDEEAQA